MSKFIVTAAFALLIGYVSVEMYDSYVHRIAYENWVADMQSDVRRLEADARRVETELTNAYAVIDDLRGDLEAEKKTSQLWFNAAMEWQKSYIEVVDQQFE